MDQKTSIELESSDINFVIIGHRAETSPDFPLNDLCGAAGRWDGLARCINTALLLSHEIRKDTNIHMILLGGKDPPKILTVSGRDIRYLNPDERSTAALMKKALNLPLSPSLRRPLCPTPGLYISRGGLDEFMDNMKGRAFLLDERGDDIYDTDVMEMLPRGGPPLFFFLSDDMDLSDQERASIMEGAHGTISVGPRVLHAHQAVAVLNNALDRSRKK
ncbi:MAG: tRNA (pseudouridine(54)-N(1))-methyltransferase TrmY [Thermoplasmata archaeon]|nr:tRNA (pseudouridine(54)-N(1))-methyltransferase TrmY [Thermoplasmata archaeon]